MDMMGNCFGTYHYVLYVSYITLIVLAKINNCWVIGFTNYILSLT